MSVLFGLLVVSGQTLAIYAFLIVCLSVSGRRQLSQLTSIELVSLMLLGSSVETSMVAGNTSLGAGLVSAGTLLVANRLLTIILARWHWLKRRIIGGPFVLVHDGALVVPNLRRCGLTEEDVLQSLRQNGYAGFADVRFAVLEIDGSLGVVPLTAPIHQRIMPVRTPSRPAPSPSA